MRDTFKDRTEDKRLIAIIAQRRCISCKKMHRDVSPLPEIDMAERWGALSTPLIRFFPENVPEDAIASNAAVATMPGAWGRHTNFNLLIWIADKGCATRKVSGNIIHVCVPGNRANGRFCALVAD